VTTKSYKTCKTPVKSSPPTNQCFTGRMPFLLPNQQCPSNEGKITVQRYSSENCYIDQFAKHVHCQVTVGQIDTKKLSSSYQVRPYTQVYFTRDNTGETSHYCSIPMCCKPILMMLFIPTPMVNCSTISTTTPVQNCLVDFHIFTIFVKNSSFCLYLRRHAKFGEDRTIHGRVIAYIRFSKWWTSAIFDLVSADHPRLVFYGPNILLKLHVDCFYILRDITIFIFGPFG